MPWIDSPELFGKVFGENGFATKWKIDDGPTVSVEVGREHMADVVAIVKRRKDGDATLKVILEPNHDPEFQAAMAVIYNGKVLGFLPDDTSYTIAATAQQLFAKYDGEWEIQSEAFLNWDEDWKDSAEKDDEVEDTFDNMFVSIDVTCPPVLRAYGISSREDYFRLDAEMKAAEAAERQRAFEIQRQRDAANAAKAAEKRAKQEAKAAAKAARPKKRFGIF